jgi:Ni2+-binding GTPase involved in maturation of urease and hydrogenase
MLVAQICSGKTGKLSDLCKRFKTDLKQDNIISGDCETGRYI